MIMPKIWSDPDGAGGEVLPMPYLVVTPELAVVAVDQNGAELATLLDHFDAGYTEGAKHELQQANHSTAWALWGECGEFIEMKDNNGESV